MNVQTLANHIKKSSQYIYYIYNKKDLDTGLLRKIADALEVNIFYFFVEHGTDFKEYTEIKPKSKPGELESCMNQIELLQKIIEDKEEIINLLKRQIK